MVFATSDIVIKNILLSLWRDCIYTMLYEWTVFLDSYELFVVSLLLLFFFAEVLFKLMRWNSILLISFGFFSKFNINDIFSVMNQF